MQKQTESQFTNVTVTDVQLASAYYPILVEQAKQKQCIYYSDLVRLAKERNPDNKTVQATIWVSTGRRLDVVRMFTSERKLPDLTALVINWGSKECGSSYTKHFNPKAVRQSIFAYNWSTVTLNFDGSIQHATVITKPRKKIKREEAVLLMAEHYKEHKASIPAYVREYRELIISVIMGGESANDAFAEVLSSVA